MGSNSISAQFVALLIEEYKGLPSLWDIDSSAYKNKFIKTKDYETLLHRMLPADPLLTMNDLKKKLANIRTCYRRELKKIENSIKMGASGDDVYVPTLWYFKQMEFLRDQEPKTSTVDQDDEEHNPVRGIFTKTQKLSPYKSEFVGVKKSHKNFVKKRRHTENDEDHQPLEDIEENRLSKNAKTIAKQFVIKDEATTFSESWALLFRKLSHEQQLFGKRCIDEILYKGQLGQLTLDTHRSIEACPIYSSDSESSTTNPGHMVDTKDMSSFLNELCGNKPGT
ncbi:uncharacterized protein LOC129907696 [Episyrphus balteatus]|uniref:uncharacterized protein LOC129907696 n=1 Tax=Episyrphus balteatus TaxID=286459 RepID=UPI0024860520|nr:uncharacterized protein LOC129907696 [Episyrphus balteatus]